MNGQRENVFVVILDFSNGSHQVFCWMESKNDFNDTKKRISYRILFHTFLEFKFSMQVLCSCVKGVERQTVVKRHNEVKQAWSFD